MVLFGGSAVLENVQLEEVGMLGEGQGHGAECCSVSIGSFSLMGLCSGLLCSATAPKQVSASLCCPLRSPAVR